MTDDPREPDESARPRRPLRLSEALFAPASLIAVYAVGASFGAGGGVLVLMALLLAALGACGQALRRGASFAILEERAGRKLADVTPAILILLSIGVLIGSWVLSGTIPALVVLGLELVEPNHLPLSAFVGTALMSLCTGTSWGSAGTLGVALMGVAAASGVSPAVTAGAVVSGAYFGDKLSPLSDSTNIAAIAARVDLYAHVRHLLYTVVPAFVVALLFYAVWPAGEGPREQSTALVSQLRQAFRGGALPWLPPLLVIAGVALRKPPVATLLGSALLAAAIGIGAQGFSLGDALTTLVDGFHAGMLESTGRTSDAPSALFRRLTDRGGVNSMAPTLVYILVAFVLASGLELSGALPLLVERMLGRVSSVLGLILATMATGSLLIGLTSHTGVTALMLGDLFRAEFDRRDLARENLSRSIEDSVTVIEPLMPWTVSALFMATTLGVPTTEYLGFAVFCYAGPLSAVGYALLFRRTGIGIKRANRPRAD